VNARAKGTLWENANVYQRKAVDKTENKIKKRIIINMLVH